MRNDLIRAVLDCGEDDLDILDDSGANMFEVIWQMRSVGLEITLNGIVEEIFKEGIFRIDKAVKSEKTRLEAEEREGVLTEAGYERLEAMRLYGLNPRRDFTYYVNCLDTHLYCDSRKKGLYEEMFEQEMQELADYTGFNIMEAY